MKKVLFALLFSMSFAFVASASNAVPTIKSKPCTKIEAKQISKVYKKLITNHFILSNQNVPNEPVACMACLEDACGNLYGCGGWFSTCADALADLKCRLL